MNFKKLFFVGALATSLAACGSSYKSQTKIETRADSVAYLMGTIDGGQQKATFEHFGLDTLLNFDTYFEALYRASNKMSLKYELDSTAKMMLTKFTNVLQLYSQKVMNDTTGTVPQLYFPQSQLDSASYLLGVADGQSLGEGYNQSGLDSVGIKFNFYYEGFREITQESEPRINVDKHRNMIAEYFAEIRQKELMARFGDNKREGEEFLAKNKANSDVVTTESGLQYTILKEGKGPKPTINSMVKVHYTGTLLDGTVFDSSVERNEPAVFGVGQVIPGWVEALQLMSVGSKWKLFIPQELAYGENGAGQIKPFSVLVFEVELLEIEK